MRGAPVLIASSNVCVVNFGFCLIGLGSGRVDHVAGGEVAASATVDHGTDSSGGGSDLAQLVFL